MAKGISSWCKRVARSPVTRWLVFVIVASGCWLGYELWFHLFRRTAAPRFANDAEHFKYGALSSGQGFPFYIWKVLPEVFADKLPGGWESLGLIFEPGNDAPVGLAKRTMGFPGLTPNCALCHSSTFRTSATGTNQMALGAPAHEFDFDAFNNFVFACAEDERFVSRHLLPKIEEKWSLSLPEKWIYRFILIPKTRSVLREQKPTLDWRHSRPAPGRGRTDAFNRFKINLLRLPDDGSIGTSDYPPLWQQRTRIGTWLHWNGSGNRIDLENLLSVLPVIGDARNFDAGSFERVTNFIWNVTPPRFPFPVDEGAARAGRALFEQHCATCHGPDGAQYGQVTPASEVKTDGEFLRMWSSNFVAHLNAIDSPPFRFGSIRRTDGYVNVPLDGCWLRAPYLHNGSVPTLWDLLQPAAARPKKFPRGGNLYDAANLGFASDPASASAPRFVLDTTLRGNVNQGHEYGTSLGDAEKRALLEYLKTL